MLAQGLQRIFTFILNTAMLRYVSADVFGYAASDMELLLSTILFISREAVRLVALRATGSVLAHSRQRQQLVNLAWLPVFVGCLMSTIAGTAVGLYSPVHERASTQIYCIAAAIESLSEPLFIVNQVLGLPRARAAVETVASLARVFGTFILVALLQLGPHGFAAGQLMFSMATLVGYCWSVQRGLHNYDMKNENSASASLSIWDILPSLRGLEPALVPSGASENALFGPVNRFASKFIGADSWSLLRAFSVQCVVKHFLTEGDRLVLTAFATREQRGAYAAVQNYGSLAARLVFQPLEEATRVLTAPLFARADAAQPPPPTNEGHHEVCPPLQEARDLVISVLFLVILLGLYCVSLGVGSAGSVVALLLGKRWADSEAPRLLSAYCVYVLAMAMNGATEAAATAAADPTRVAASTLQMCGFFALYAGVAVGGLRAGFGTPSLIVAGCANMAFRAWSSWAFLVQRFRYASRANAPAVRLSPPAALQAWPSKPARHRRLPKGGAPRPLCRHGLGVHV